MEDVELIAGYSEHINAGLARVLAFMGMDAAAVRAEGPYVFDDKGRRFLDFLGGYGVFNFGHAHPRIVAAVKAELERMPLSSKLLVDEPAVRAAKRLSAVTPGEISKFFFTNSGTESVEGALKLARLHNGRAGFVYARGSFHGKTLGSLSASGRDQHREPFEPLLAQFIQVPFGDADALAAVVDENTCAVLLEPLQGEGGINVPPDGYLRSAREIAAEHGALLILDEVQTGMGRTGHNFACEREGVVPDLIVLAKALGGGVMPVGAIGGPPEVWAQFEQKPLIHSSTFGGNPMACAAADAALQVLVEEKLAGRAGRIGESFLAELQSLREKYPAILADVRGRGLMIGLQFASTDVAEVAIGAILAKELLVAFTLNAPEVVRLEPPLNTPEELFPEAISRLDAALGEATALVEQYA
jgi:putrescine aminotransferase